MTNIQIAASLWIVCVAFIFAWFVGWRNVIQIYSVAAATILTLASVTYLIMTLT